MNTPVIKAINLTKNFGKLTAVNNLNLEVNSGEIFAFLGPNGAGKTTTVKLLTGLLHPTGGSAMIAGHDISKEPISAKKEFGLVSDQPYVYPHLTGFEFMRLVGDLYSVNIDYQKEKIPELLEMFELKAWADELTESYSHGMKQKLVIASVLLHNPKVMFLDEPLVGLDPKSARLVKDVFITLAKKGTCIFMCTHVLEIAERLAHRVGIILAGKLIAVETVETLKKNASTTGNLEDVFLEMTGGTEYTDLLKYL
jgi:ABC-2 type transport system ATP-binding protein